MRSLPSLARVAALAAATSVPLSAGGVLIVDDDFGPGVDHSDLPAAVAAALDDDVLLVRGGVYSGFQLNGKGLHVVAEQGATVTLVSGLAVRNLAPGQRVSLRGLDVVQSDEEALIVANCDGPVWVEDCTLVGADGGGLFSNPNGPDGKAAARVSASTASFQRCSLTAGNGDFYIPLTQLNGAGGDALRSENGARITAYGCSFTGGHGGDVADDDAAWDGGRGGHGVWVQSGDLLLSDCVLVAGNGGVGGSDTDPFLGDLCGSGGPGGGGIFQPTFPVGLADVWLQSVDIAVGVGGDGFEGCPAGGPGTELTLPNTTLETLTSVPFQFSLSAPLRTTETLEIEASGEPGSFARFGASATQGFTVFPAVPGIVDLGTDALSVFPMGTVLPDGTLSFQLPLFFTLPADTALPIYTQGTSAALGGATLGGGSLLLLVGPMS